MPLIVKTGCFSLSLGSTAMIFGLIFFTWQLVLTGVSYSERHEGDIIIKEPAAFMAVGLCLICGVIFQNKYLISVWILGSVVSTIIVVREFLCRIAGSPSCLQENKKYDIGFVAVSIIMILEVAYEIIAMRYVLSYYYIVLNSWTVPGQ